MGISRNYRIGYFVYALLLLTTAGPIAAQQPNPQKLTITDIAKAGADFQLQGEYIGTIGTRRRAQSMLGLQVVALGDGQFQAVGYPGGLPGAGWTGRTDSMEMIVTNDPKKDSLAIVSCVNSEVHYSIRLENNVALVYSEEQQYLGQLTKIKRASPTLHLPAPSTATVLFDGKSTDHFENGRINEDGLLMTGTTTNVAVNDFHLHLEFRTPYMPYARGQARGNSGVYIQRRYEVQILDSFGLSGEHNECGGLYRQQSPAINMCLPPLAWQTYDIYFQAARWDKDNKKTGNAVITVYHNGFPIHNQQEIKNKTGAGKAEGPEPMPIHLQHHGNPVVFRNIWIDQAPAASPSDIVEASTKQRCRSRRILRRRR